MKVPANKFSSENQAGVFAKLFFFNISKKICNPSKTGLRPTVSKHWSITGIKTLVDNQYLKHKNRYLNHKNRYLNTELQFP